MIALRWPDNFISRYNNNIWFALISFCYDKISVGKNGSHSCQNYVQCSCAVSFLKFIAKDNGPWIILFVKSSKILTDKKNENFYSKKCSQKLLSCALKWETNVISKECYEQLDRKWGHLSKMK